MFGPRTRAPLADPGRPLTVTTSDGVTLRGLRVPCRDTFGLDAGTHVRNEGAGPVFVVCHGFTNSTAKPSTRAVIDLLAGFETVVALDFRGHGRSGGLASVGRDEILDLDAAVGWARSEGHGPVHVVGFSMGASVALRHAALAGRTGEGVHHLPDTVVSVSSPSRWYIRDSAPMRRVHWLLEHPLGPTVGRLLGVRLGEAWTDIPGTPLELIERIDSTPLLLVHGTADHYFSPAHALALKAASAGHAELWIEDGMAHAESGSGPDLIERIARWAHALSAPSAAV
ncbi:pimeloyl-ACP methyl ester carboxylesterase [Nakamurella sp. UYEF19]|uniref:alpha/beta hydrolase family protein n=1 Tax=Nakamurella sp. UYEF19 TaxID=1756392 RepID=UPI0033997B86